MLTHRSNGRLFSNHGIVDDVALTASNENKMSDGWRESAWLRVEGGIS
jgi:hypothetical protein